MGAGAPLKHQHGHSDEGTQLPVTVMQGSHGVCSDGVVGPRVAAGVYRGCSARGLSASRDRDAFAAIAVAVAAVAVHRGWPALRGVVSLTSAARADKCVTSIIP